MFRFYRPLSLATAVTIASALVAPVVHAQSAGMLFERAATKYESAKTLRIKFKQTLKNSFMGTTNVASGELLRQQPNLFAINFTSTKDRIVCDGTSLWLYLPSSAPDQVIKTPIDKMGTVLVDPLGQILTAPRDQYTVANAGTAQIAGHETHAIVVTPKHDGASFTKATVWIDDTDDTVWRIMTVEPNGVQRDIVVTDVTMNGSIPRAAFTFTPPANVHVVSQRTALGS
jgi:chaperone LolA